MGKIIRTYPTPDTKRENCGPRERALAVFKYIMGIEPEEAKDHPRFDVIVNAFEQQRRIAIRETLADVQEADENGTMLPDPPELVEALEPELTGEQEVNLPHPLDVARGQEGRS